jgi:4-hydroxy-tetrahydrodipicolinate synthase
VARVHDLLARLEPYALIPALKGIMALLDDDTGWLRVRPPLVALEPDALAALRQSIGAVGLDRAKD